MINVTKTFFPPILEYSAQLERIWKNEWLTNRGQLTVELEEKLKAYLGIGNIIIMNNGTLPLQISLKNIAKNGEVITTPFSYVATTSSILWENCTPVFVDIDKDSLTIDVAKIESAINDRTTCILATHVFGNPCDIEEIEKIAKKYDIKVIYDAAHCFGVKYNGKSIFEYGDISTCSFHATKLFHTGEGGALFCNDVNLRFKLYYSHNFGHNGPVDFYGLGINAKISELQSAMGLAVLPHMEEILNRRKEVVNQYDSLLNFNQYEKIKIREKTIWNFSYYPIICSNEQQLLNIQEKLNNFNIFPRRYFYPSLNTLKFIGTKFSCPISENISNRILCLPLSHDLKKVDIELISKIVSKC
jgi:dTDP-4-amino-4,6-dideoxygalactose transaminase